MHCVFFIHGSDTGHAEVVPIGTSRGRRVEFPSKGNRHFDKRDAHIERGKTNKRPVIDHENKCLIFFL